jgi:hypothetical protein
MPIDPRIALGVQPLQVADPMARYGQMQNLLASQSQLRSAETQQQVSQMQLDQMRRDEATLKQIQAKAVQGGGPSDLNKIAEAYINSSNPKFVEFGVGLRQKLDEQAKFAQIMGLGFASTPAMPSVAPASGALGSGTYDPNAPVSAPMSTLAQRSATGTNLPSIGATNQLAPAPAAPVNRLAPGVDVSALRRKRDALLAMGTNQSIAAARAMDADIALASKEPAYQNVAGVGLVDPRDGRVIVPSVESTDPVVKQYEYAKGQGFVGTLFEFKRKLAEATRAPAQPRAEQPPVAVIGPDGKEIYVTREEALTNRMSPAGKSALTESQGNAAMFGSAMAQAQQVLTQAEREGTTTGAGTVNLAQGIVKYVPLGVGDKLVNDIYALAVNDPTKLFGPDVNQQKVGQAQLAFAIAYLRKTSGAAFGASEVANTIMEYFPSVGEDKAVVKQKAESRKRAIAGMKMGAGREGAKFIEQYESPSGGTSGSGASASDPLGLFPAKKP